jgi:glycerate-2-kinase
VRKDILRALDEGIRAADPALILKKSTRIRGDALQVQTLHLDLSSFRRVLIVGGGKASARMAVELERILGRWLTAGVVNVPEGQDLPSGNGRVSFNRATHPIPSESGERGVRLMLKMVGRPNRDDLVFCLISGGASALLPLPARDVSLEDKAELTRMLLVSGADIHELNTVRKHLSAIKGGRLAELLHPATVVSLIISDVVGDRIDSIGSGLTAPDPTTYDDARRILVERRLWSECTPAIRRVIERGIRGEIKETPKKGSSVFEKTHNFILASNEISRERAARTIRALGYATSVSSREFAGEASAVGSHFAEEAARRSRLHRGEPWAIVAGGETVVRVEGRGVGGRNQELVLAACEGLSGLKNVGLASVATDGIESSTDAAGAIADGDTLRRAMGKGLNRDLYLRNHDSYHFFEPLGDLIRTGPTGTNVNDLLIVAGLPMAP